MSYESLIAIVAALVGIFALLRSLIKTQKRKKGLNCEITTERGKRYKVPADLSSKDLEKLMKMLQEKENAEMELKKKKPHNEHGFIISEFFIYFVPGIIALLFAVTFVYLLVKNQGNPNYTTPKELASAMTMIIGYFFGVGVSSAAQKGRTLTQEEVKKLIDNTT